MRINPQHDNSLLLERPEGCRVYGALEVPLSMIRIPKPACSNEGCIKGSVMGRYETNQFVKILPCLHRVVSYAHTGHAPH